MATTGFEQDWLDMQQKYGSGIDTGDIVILRVDEIDATVTIPAAKFEQPYVEGGNNVFSSFRHVPLQTFLNVIQADADEIQEHWEEWFGEDATSGVQKQWADIKTESQTATFAANTAASSANTAAAEATTAASSATTAASNVQTAIDNVNAAASNANEKAAAANTAASNANEKATAADNAATNANEKAALANTAAGTANTAAQNANEKATLANTSAANANTATTAAQNATTAAQTATTAAENVNAMLGSTGGIVTLTVIDRTGTSTSREVGFRIAKTYASVEAMNAAIGTQQDVSQGQFVMISSNVQDPHNAEMYVRNTSSFGFVADFSGSQGIKGDTPVMTASADGIIYADGTELTRVIKNAVDTFNTNETTRQNTFNASQTSRETTWTNWFSDTLSTGVRKIWNDFWSSINTSWNGFFGTSAEDANGVRKIWSTWYSATQSAWSSWFGSSSSTGVQGEWSTLKSDAQSATSAANTAASNANAKASEAENVNATLSGTTITVTNRQGQSTSANLKGDKGDQGDKGDTGEQGIQGIQGEKGDTGDAAGFGTPTATVDSNVGTPSVTVTASGSDTAKVFAFAFSNLKGDKGDKGDDLDYSTMTPQEYQQLVENVKQDLVFASVETAESIIDEII